MDTVILNLLEAWCSLIFQTLQVKDLLEYLPPGTILFPHAGTHLNIAHPLWQGFAKSKGDIYASAEPGERRKAFSDLVRNSEGEYREYYQSLSRNFKDLKYSPKDALREYYLAADRRRVASLSASSRKRTREGLLHGVDKKVIKMSRGDMRVKFGFIELRFPASLSSEIRDEVHVQGFLTPDLNPNVYATGETPEDPARRLSIQLTIENHQGRFQVWVTAGGDQTAKMINSLVEILEGVLDEEIAKRPRRYLGKNKRKGHLGSWYTS